MATSAERTKGLRKRERRGLRSFTVPVSEDDLRVMAKHGYEGVLSTNPDQQARALRLFIADMLAARRPGNGVKAVATSFQKVSLPLQRVSVVRKVVSAQFRCREEGRGQVCAHSAAVLDCGLDLGHPFFKPNLLIWRLIFACARTGAGLSGPRCASEQGEGTADLSQSGGSGTAVSRPQCANSMTM